MKSRLLLLLACLALAPGPLLAGELPPYLAADPGAPPVTAQNLLASERFWPYRVALTRPWSGASGAELPAGWEGILIRVEPDRRARIDFGRDGLFTLPLGATDLVERAERVRRGEDEKLAPNLVLAIGPRLLDAGADAPQTLGLEAALARRGFLAVYADPAADGFAEQARALAPLQDRHGVLSVLFPLGRHPDAQVYAQLRAAGWKPSFVFDHLADGYAASLLDAAVPRPALQLQTNEGRVLFESPWTPGAVAALTAALEREFGSE